MTAYILTLSCPDRPGLVALVATTLFSCGGNIIDAQQFNDRETGLFFMRVVFESTTSRDILQKNLSTMAQPDAMHWRLHPRDEKPRVLILVSKFDHCLGDLLYRARIGELPMAIMGIIANHRRETLNVPVPEEIPFHHLPVTSETKPRQEQAIKRIATETGAELVILARYMQILSNDLASFLAGRCINIHHSFLPSFKGARPYHQAHARGVKMIGATAHYVTAALDEGPIIHQAVEAVSHSDSPEDLVRKGRNIEQRVLAHATLCHLERRVLMNGHKTIVFSD